jgi:hypothetical protein
MDLGFGENGTMRRNLAEPTPASNLPSAVFDARRNLRKPMDLVVWLDANHSDARWHREDLQRRQAAKGAVLCSA